MKLVTFLDNGRKQLALLIDGILYRTQDLEKDIPDRMEAFLGNWDRYTTKLRRVLSQLPSVQPEVTGTPIGEATLLAPVPHPPSCRDGYAFRQHVATARGNRGVPMIPEFDSYPVFYFTNARSVRGPGSIACMPDHFQRLDFELEVAIVISRRGINIRAEDAAEYIAGFMLMNDLSARQLQMEEMLLNLGPAKGKDFATSTGPWLVTPDELVALEIPPKPRHRGQAYDLRLSARVNGRTVSSGNLADMDWTFGELIERASYGAELFPGDLIGSGTVGTGCFLELNGTARLEDPLSEEQWLQPGDVVELEGEQLGILSNTIERYPSDSSLLNKKL